MTDRSGSLALRGVVKRYASKTEVVDAVDNVSLEVDRGKVVALVGPSGSGKTTLLLLAAGLIAPDTGTVSFNDRDLGSMSATEAGDFRRHDVGIVHQTFHLIAGASALDNAAMKLIADNVPLKEARRQAAPWLDRLGLEKRKDHLPSELSGGERQRVAIARALANGPRLILADEPTASLDSHRAADVLALLAAHCHDHGVGMLLVTHDFDGAAIADKSHTLRDGALVPATPPAAAPRDPVSSG